MKYLVIFLILIGLVIPSVAFAQYLGDVEFYHLPLTVESKQYFVLAQSNTNYFNDVTYDKEAGSLIFSTSSSEDFIDTYTITMNEQIFSELLATDYAKTPDSMLVLINGIEQPYQIFKNNEILSWRFYASISSDEVELIPSNPRLGTGTKFDNVPTGIPKIYPPLKQDHVGIIAKNIQCKENLILVQKYDGSPACVTEQTKQKLIERGWILDLSIQMIIEHLKEGSHDVNPEHEEFIKNLVLLDARVSGFIDDKDWDYSCCGYLSNEEKRPGEYNLTINFFDYDNEKQLLVVFNLQSLQIVQTQTSDFVFTGVPPMIKSDTLSGTENEN